MRRTPIPPLIGLAVLALFASGTLSQPMGPSPEEREPRWFVSMIQSKAATARQYIFEASIDLSRKYGEGPSEMVGKFEVKLAVAPGNRYLFWLGDKTHLQYLIVSDGQRTSWYSPSDNKYVELEAITTASAANPETVFSKGVTKNDADPVLCSNLVVPILAGLDHHAAAVVDMRRSSDRSQGGEEAELPILTVLSNRTNSGRQRLAELSLDPETFALGRLNWSKAVPVAEESRFAILNATFSSFQLNEPIPPSYFVFNPGNAQRLEAVPVPGFDGASIVGQPAPEFELESRDRKKIVLSALRGRTVLISISAPDCPPCQKQSAVLDGIQEEYQHRGLVVLDGQVVNAPLDWLPQIRFLPTLLLINQKGDVVRFLPGAHDANRIRAVLNGSGLK